MNNLNIFNRFIWLIVWMFFTLLSTTHADDVAVSFENIDTYSTNITSNAIVSDGNYAYVANGLNGIVILDNNGTNIQEILSSSVDSKNITDIAVSGTNLYLLAKGYGLYIVDFNGSDINVTSTLPISGDLNSLVVKSDYIYIANGANGVLTVDIRDKSQPKDIALLTTTDAKKLILKESTLYLADSWGGLRTISISNQTLPSIVSTDVGETFIDLDIDNKKLFAIGADKIQAYDITNPLLAVKKGSVDMVDEVLTSVFAYSSKVFVAIKDSSIRAYNTLDIENIVVSGGVDYTVTTTVNDFFVSKSFAYISNSQSINLALFSSDFSSTIENATSVGELPVTVKGSLPESESDIDILQIELSTFGELSIDIVTDVQNIKCSVLDETGVLIKDINNSVDNSDIESFNVSLESGTYYIQIESFNDSFGDYEITMNTFDDDYSDDINGAILVHLDEYFSGAVIESTSDKDIFKLYLSAAGTLSVESDSVQLITNIYKNKKDDEILGSGTIEDGIKYTIPHSGYYFVQFSSNTAGYVYGFKASFSSSSGSEYDDVYKPALKEYNIDTLNSTRAVALNSSNLFLGSGTQLQKRALDVSLSVLGSVETSSSIENIEVIGDYAYVSHGIAGIGIYDITSDTPSLKSILSIDGGKSISKIIVDGSFAYTFNSNRLYKIDISNKSKPCNQLNL